MARNVIELHLQLARKLIIEKKYSKSSLKILFQYLEEIKRNLLI